MRDFGFAMGPFEAQDLGGLDIAFLQREAARARGETVPETLGDVLVRAGRKGQKTGGGWYDYAPGDRTPRPSPRSPRSSPRAIARGRRARADIAEHLVAEMAAEGEAILAEGIAARARRHRPRRDPRLRLSAPPRRPDVPQRPVVPEHSRR